MDNQEIIPETYFHDDCMFLTIKTLVGGNPLVLPQNFSSCPYTKELLAKSVFYYYIKNKHDHIVFSSYVEGLNGSCMFFADDIIKILHDRYKVPLSKFIYLTGCFANEHNLNCYIEHCKKYGFYGVQLKFVNVYEHMAQGDANKNIDIINKDPLDYKPKQKYFLCFNGVARAHRVILIGEIFARNLHPFTYLSCYDDQFMKKVRESKWVVDKKIYGDRFFRLFYELETRKDLFPMNLSLNENNIKSHLYNSIDHTLYKNSYISIVNETDFFQYYHSGHCISLNCTFPTEKTFKPIKARHPFIIVSRPHFLKHLKQSGYKTFHPHINESYDDIENDEKRMNAIANELERLGKYSEQEWSNFLYHINHICQYNFEHLLISGSELKLTTV